MTPLLDQFGYFVESFLVSRHEDQPQRRMAGKKPFIAVEHELLFRFARAAGDPDDFPGPEAEQLSQFGRGGIVAIRFDAVVLD